MKIQPYLNFDGQCEEAFRFYERVLGGKIEAMMPFEGSPAEGEVPPEARGKIMHACLTVGEEVIMASDCPPGRYEKPQGVYISLGIEKAAEGERVFKALAEGGNVVMPFEKTFWAAGFGMVVDRFGTPWMVNCEKEKAD